MITVSWILEHSRFWVLDLEIRDAQPVLLKEAHRVEMATVRDPLGKMIAKASLRKRHCS
jgi:hypothetical protein